MELLHVAMYLLLSSAFILSFFTLIKRYKTGQKLPPGPLPLPIIGNLMNLGDKPHKSMAELSKIYGPFLTLKLGQLTMIVISSPDIAKEVLQKQDLAFSTRFVPNSFQGNDSYKHSVGWIPVSDKWRNLRKIMNSAIFCRSKLDSSQHLRCQKVNELIAFVDKCCQEGVAVDIGQATFTTSLNFLSNTIFSVDLANMNDDSSKGFRDIVKNILIEAGKPNLADFFPAVAKIDPQGIRRQVAGLFRKMLAIVSELIDQRVELRREEKVDENDMLDVILNINQETAEKIDISETVRLFVDLFIAGTDTTSSTVEWAMAELLHNPELLKKAKIELEQTIGKGKPIEETHLTRLPYLQAVVKETVRMHPAAPLLVPRTVVADVEVCGYIVPKGAQVVVNVWAMGRDPGIWVNPMLFSPERFLGSEKDFRGQDFEFIPFGSGRRICPGLPMAIRIIPVVLGSLLNSFDWKLEDGHRQEDLDMEEKFGVTLQKAQPLRVIPFQS